MIIPAIPGDGPMNNPIEEDPVISVLKSDETGVILEIELPYVEVKEIEENGEIFQLLTIPGYGSTFEVGLPEIPVIRETIALPNDVSSFSIHVLDSSYTVSTGFNVYPVQTPELDSDDENDFVINEDFYDVDAFYPEDVVLNDDASLWRDINTLSLQVNPVMYNANTTELEVYDYILLEISYDSSGFSSPSISPVFSQLMKSVILNSDSLNSVDGRDGRDNDSDYKYLAISNPSLENAVKPLIEWKHRKGLKAKLVNTTVTGTTANSIKNYITTFYDANSDLEYVLLVGDIADVPWYTGWGVTGSDYWYGEVVGDLYPELSVGRISAVNDAEVTQQITKMISYETNPPIGDWVNNAILVAHKEGSPGKYEGCLETIRTNPYTDGYSFITAYGSQGESNTDVNNKINAGAGILNYRGHGGYNCWCDGWTTAHSYGYYTTDVDLLTNGNFTPIHYCIACSTADLSNSDETLAESFLKDDDAAVGYLSATEPSYTTPNHMFDQELFQASGNQDIYNIGWISNYANTRLSDYYGQTSYYIDNVKMYIWLADPSLELWTDTPKNLTVTHPLIISKELSTLFNTTVKENGTGVENAFVCIENGNDFYQTGYTNDSGIMQFDISNASGYLNVTVTKHNYIPYVGSADIPVRIHLNPGWNFVSLPVDRIVDKTNLKIWNGSELLLWPDAVSNNIVNSYMFGWNRSTQSYSFSDKFAPGSGYWMYANDVSEIWIEDNTKLNPEITLFEKDWNMAGISANQTVNFSELMIRYNATDYSWMDAVNMSIINNYVFGWDSVGQSYVFSTQFTPGQAYWFYTFQQCMLKAN